MFGKKLSEYIRFEWPILTLILAVALGRVGLWLGGAELGTVKWLSVIAAMAVGSLYCGIAVHTRGFGSYKQLYGLLLIQGVAAECIPVLGIALALLTGHDNLFTVPEFSPSGGGRTWGHLLEHITAGAVVLPLLAWLAGAIVLLAAKRQASGPPPCR